MTDLRLLIKECDYDAGEQEKMIRDHIVFGIRSSKVREKLISEGDDLTLEKCMNIARTHELSQKSTSRQRSGKGAIRKRLPLQKPRWEKNKLTIRYLYHENIS